MPSKKRYELQKAWKEFDKLLRPAYIDEPCCQKLPEINLAELENALKETLRRQGSHWGSNNKGRGAAIANRSRHRQSIARAKELIYQYADLLGKRGLIKRISLEHGISESTVRRYIQLYKENSQGQ